MQAFLVEKASFKGFWEMATHDISITVGEPIGSGGMRQCFHASIRRFPPQFGVEAPYGWVAKFYKKEVPGESYDLCRKVGFFFFKRAQSAIFSVQLKIDVIAVIGLFQ